MAPAVLIFYTVCCMLAQILVINTASNETLNQDDITTYSASKWNLGRLKRSLDEEMPKKLEIRVKYENGEEIILNWVKKTNYLANQHLPVHSSSGHWEKTVMEDVGEFVLYDDLGKCSSVAYFHKTQTFIGQLGMNYVIDELPFNFDADGSYLGVAKAPYIMKRPEIPIHVQPIVVNVPNMSGNRENLISLRNCRSNRNDRHSSITDPGPSPKHRRTERDYENYFEEMNRNTNVSTKSNIRTRRWNPILQKYYLETMVFITHDIVHMFESYYSANHSIKWIVKYLIRYFNAVDTFFQKRRMSFMTMNVNIARIIMLDNSQLLDLTNNGEIQSAKTIAKLRNYLKNHQTRYTPDSFDHVLMITNHRIIHNLIRVPGMTDFSANLYEKRDEGQFYNAVPITVVEFGSNFAYAVHEIGRTLNIKVAPSVEEMERSWQCHGIMQQGSSMCNRCLKWSEADEQQFIEFFKTNHNRCFLLNEPRSLRPPGPSVFLSAHTQCLCSGYRSLDQTSSGREKKIISADECDVALRCQTNGKDQPLLGYILPPFDGTRCGSGYHVCWERKCILYASASDRRRTRKH